MIGADRSVHGGVSAVVNNYYKAGLDKKVELRYIGTMVDGSRRRKLMQAVWAYGRFLTTLPWMDILHVNMAADASFYRKKIFIDTAAFFHKKIVIHEHGGDFKGFYYDRNREKGRTVIDRTLNKAQVFLTLSDAWAEFFKPIVRQDKIVVLENAIAIPQQCKKEYDNHNLLFLGRLCKEKGISELLEAIPEAAVKYPDVTLYLGGVWEDDALKEKAQSLSNHIVYLGWIGEEEKAQYMEKCSIFVLPTYFEGQPVSILEAMAKGMAVISTAVGGIPQILQNEKEGILIPPKDAGRLCDSICTLIDNTELKRKYGAQAREQVRKNYDIEKHVQRLTEIYEKVYRG